MVDLARMAVLQEAAAALQERLGDPSAVFLAASPEEGKVAMAAAISPAAVAGGLQVFDRPMCICHQAGQPLLSALLYGPRSCTADHL